MQQIACRHLRTGCIYGSGERCTLCGRYVECHGVITRCNCPEDRARYDLHRSAPTSMVVKLARLGR